MTSRQNSLAGDRPSPLARWRPTSLAGAEAVYGWLFASPWLIGFLIFTLGPMVASLFLSFTEWSLISTPKWVGLKNYITLLSDPLVGKSLWVTTLYSVTSVPINLALGFGLALLLNQKLPGMALFRTIYYLPSILTGVAVSLLWSWVLAPEYGLLNTTLAWFGIQGPNWLYDTRTALISLVMMSVWGVGGSMLIYLAGLQSIPTSLEEAAAVDGANVWHRFRHITIPLMTPVIFFNLIMGLIASLQVFTQAYIITKGGPDNATLFFMLHLYQNAFSFFKMGYASALAWVLFAYIMALTLLTLKSSPAWVYYETTMNKPQGRAEG